MSFTFRTGAREKTPVIIGLTGPTGSGKTYSALKLATGMALGGPVYAIDTEARRMLRYAEEFNFQYLEFPAPFSSKRYQEAIEAAARHKPSVIVVDSTSHEHEGQGGHLSFHDAELDRMAGNDYGKREKLKFTAWIKPKAERQALINLILQTQCNFVFCFRAKEKLKMVRDAKNKTQVVPIGWQPICGDELAYEMTTMCILPPSAQGVPDWTAQAARIEHHHKFAFPDGQPLAKETGQLMAEWAAGNKPTQSSTVATPAPGAVEEGDAGDMVARNAGVSNLPDEPTEETIETAREKATEGARVFNAWFAKLSFPEQDRVETIKDELRQRMVAAEQRSKESAET